MIDLKGTRPSVNNEDWEVLLRSMGASQENNNQGFTFGQWSGIKECKSFGDCRKSLRAVLA